MSWSRVGSTRAGKKNEAVLDELFAPSFVVKGLNGDLTREDFRQFFRAMTAAFAHVQIVINEAYERGDDFAVQSTLTLTGWDGSKHVCAGAGFGTVRDGKFTRTQDQWDFTSILESTQTIPAGSLANMMVACAAKAPRLPTPKRRFLDEWFHRLWTLRDRSVIEEKVDEACVIIGLPNTNSRASFHAFFEAFAGAFQKVEIKVDESVEEGETIAFRCSATATDCTGQTHPFVGGGFVKIRDGKMIEAWNQWDFLSLLESAGTLPKSSFGEGLAELARQAAKARA
ncbi:MAG: nuclear transport factor 2 family protein [Polyangiaceae bacterium]